jgi:hypothetical protein
MERYSDLPHKRFVNGKWIWEPFEGKSAAYWEAVGDRTAHTGPNLRKQPCQRCGKKPSLIVIKPESLFVWCVKCS